MRRPLWLISGSCWDLWEMLIPTIDLITVSDIWSTTIQDRLLYHTCIIISLYVCLWTLLFTNMLFINLYFHQFAFSSICLFINLPFHQFAFSSICLFINLPFHQFAFSSICIFINLYFYRFVFSSTCISINLLFCPIFF